MPLAERWSLNAGGRHQIENKTVTVNLTDDQHERYAAWFVEAQRLRALLSDLEELSLRIASRGEHFGPRKSR